MKQLIKPFAAIAVLCAVTAGALFFAARSRAERPVYWITVDARELAHVQDALAAGGDAELKAAAVEFERDGVAALRLDAEQMEKLSSAMHENFHKCAGFALHESRDAALEAIARDAAVDNAQQLVDYTIDNQANVTPLLAEASEASTRQVITDLSTNFPTRRHNSATGLQSATWIKDKWTALAAGRSDVTVEFVTHTNTPQPSVVMTVRGTTLPDEIVVLGGHQDSIAGSVTTNPAPGADDDASGIASLTETIRVLMAKNFRPNRTVQFMAYAAEEVGLVGSAAIALDYRNRNVNVVGVMQLDMTNYKGSTQFDIVMITDRTNAAQNTFVTNLVTTYQPSLVVGTSSCGYACSDHASWNTRSYPASFPHEATLQTGNPFIHTANDTLAQSSNNANHAIKFTKLALSYVGELAKGAIAAAPRRAPVDFDGDAKTDVSIFRPAAGEWWYQRSSNGAVGVGQFGAAADRLVPADFTGDGKTDLALFRPAAGQWFVLRSEDNSFFSFPFGAATDVPLVADFDADGKADPTVFRPATREWFISKSSGGTAIVTFGAAGDLPVPADFDGDGKADIAIYRPDAGEWWINRSSTNQTIAFRFGTATDKIVAADYTGDGKADAAFFRPASGEWFVLRSEDGSFFAQPFGASGDLAAPGDYDGDGKTDFAVFRSASSTWYVNRSTAGVLIQTFGTAGDAPVPNSFVR